MRVRADFCLFHQRTPARKLCWSLLVQTAVRTLLIIILSPSPDHISCLFAPLVSIAFSFSAASALPGSKINTFLYHLMASSF